MYEDLAENARIEISRLTRSEIKFVVTINVQELNKKIDSLAKAYRELDAKIQQFNWLIDLIE